MRTVARQLVGRIFHLKWPRYKHEENSLRGIRYAARHGFPAIDLDILITKDGVVVGCHWDRPIRRDGFRDPLGRIASSSRVRDLTWVQVARLRAGSRRRRYRINRLERLLVACARHRVIAVIEPKDDPRFALDETWEEIAAMVARAGARASVRALPQNSAALAPARKAGFKAWEI